MIISRVNRRRAFTLIEMLVSIAILLILASLIVPAVRDARQRGRDVKCKNNLKQLQVASMTYAINNGGNLPHSRSEEHHRTDYLCPHDKSKAWQKAHTGWIDWLNYNCHHNYNVDNANDYDRRPGEVRWWGPGGLTCITNGALWAYVGKTPKVYACPEWQKGDVRGKLDPLGLQLTTTTNNFPWRCYAMNRSISGASIGRIEASKRVIFTEVSNTNFLNGVQISSRCMMTNYTGQSQTLEEDAWDGSFSCTSVGTNAHSYENIGLYHNGKGNVVFADGHIERLTWNVMTNACVGIW
jgi:prepilin-type N-terminal cleavage/methylation domain-containing protein/prepilin-type processing-associated H-X9-DG protein